VPTYPPEGSAQLALDKITIYVTHIGPGIFFALFGAVLIGYSVSRGVKYEESKEGGRIFSGMMPGPGSLASPEQGSVTREPVIKSLAELAEELRTKGVAEPKKEIALREARVCLMREVWKKEWGDFSDFHRWVYEEAEGDHPSPRISRAVAVYRGAP
jgi:hypothetical protein